MDINHSPKIDGREPKGDDLEVFTNLEEGDTVNFFEWAVEPLTVIGWEDDETVGERVRVEAEGGESFLYEVDGQIWHYVDEREYKGKNNPFPVQSLVLVDTVEN